MIVTNVNVPTKLCIRVKAMIELANIRLQLKRKYPDRERVAFLLNGNKYSH